MKEEQQLSQTIDVQTPRENGWHSPMALVVVFAVALLIVACIVGRDTIVAIAGPLTFLVAIGLGAIILLTIGLAGWYFTHTVQHKQKMHDLEREKLAAEIEEKRFRTRILEPDMVGNYGSYVDANGVVIQPERGNFVQAVPANYSPHIHHESNQEGGAANNAPQIASKILQEARNLLAGKYEQIAAPAVSSHPVPTGRELLSNGTVEQQLATGRIVLGVGEDGGLKTLLRKKVFSTLVSGLPSVGKTTTVFWIAAQIVIDGGRVWIVDPHMHFQDEDGNKSLAAELTELQAEALRLGQPNPFVFSPCDDNPQAIAQRMKWMYQQLLERKQPGYIVRAKDTILAIMDEFNSIADEMDPELTIVVHEGQPLNFAQTLALLEREGRKYGLHFMLIGHKWARQDIGGENAVRTNATTYLCHRLNDETQANLLLGSGGGKKILTLPVGAYWITGPTWNAEPAKIHTPMISANDLPVILLVRGRLAERETIPPGFRRGTPQREPTQEHFSERNDEHIIDADTGDHEAIRDRTDNVIPFAKTQEDEPVEATQSTSSERKKYLLTTEDIDRFITAYRAIGNIDKALAAIGKGTHFREHARRIIQVYGLREEA
jgi:hypothetical protein